MLPLHSCHLRPFVELHTQQARHVHQERGHDTCKQQPAGQYTSSTRLQHTTATRSWHHTVPAHAEEHCGTSINHASLQCGGPALKVTLTLIWHVVAGSHGLWCMMLPLQHVIASVCVQAHRGSLMFATTHFVGSNPKQQHAYTTCDKHDQAKTAKGCRGISVLTPIKWWR
jgi:hypothetical protein